MLNRCLDTFMKKGFFKKYELQSFNNDFLIGAFKTTFFISLKHFLFHILLSLYGYGRFISKSIKFIGFRSK